MKRKKVRFIELTDRFITRKTIFCFCSQKVVLRGRTTAPLKICLRGQVFVRVETSRSHLAWSTDDRNLTEFLVIKTNLSTFCLKCDPSLSDWIKTIILMLNLYKCQLRRLFVPFACSGRHGTFQLIVQILRCPVPYSFHTFQ